MMAADGHNQPIVVIGAGGHAKVVIEALRWSGWNVIGCTDGDPSPRQVVGAPVIGGDDALPGLLDSGVGQVDVGPAGEAVFEVPGRFAMANQHQFVHGGLCVEKWCRSPAF